MFCQTCGAENANKARFCNMCGIPIAEPGSPGGPLPELSKPSEQAQSNDTIAMPMTPAQAQVIATMSQPIIASKPPDSGSDVPQDAVTARPNPKNHEAGRTSHGVGLDPALPDMVKEAPRAEVTSPENARPAELAEPAGHPVRRKEETWEKRAASAGSPFDTTTSVSLEAIGLPSTKQRLAVVLGGGLLLMTAGALFMYLAMKPGDPAPDSDNTVNKVDDEARPEMVLGMPVPADDLTPDAGLEGSHDSEHSKNVDGTGTTTTNKTSSNKNTAGRSGGGKSSGSQSSKTTARTGGSSGRQSTGSDTNSVAGSSGKTATASGGTSGASSNTDTGAPTESHNDTQTEAPDEAPEERNLELEMYSSRVRYAVSRYYAARAQSCFDNITKNEPDLRGTVQVAFRISQNGQVSGSRITKNTTGHTGLGKCLVAQVNAWRLPPPPEPDIELQMPFSR